LRSPENVSDDDRRFTLQWDAVDPFDPEYPHLWIKVEHLGRYLFASNYLCQIGVTRVADIGCGFGYGSAELTNSVGCVVGVDFDADLISSSTSRNTNESLIFRHAEIGTGTVHQVSEGVPFEAAVCFETLEHLKDPAGALDELRAILHPGGTLILSVPNSVSERTDPVGLMSNRFHHRMFSISSITGLLTGAGFTVREILGQPIAFEINQNETRLIRRQQTTGRIGDEPAFHQPKTIRRLALAIGYPEPRDVERSYSIIAVATRNDFQS
jgi:SAM-dependent methyltransferase